MHMCSYSAQLSLPVCFFLCVFLVGFFFFFVYKSFIIFLNLLPFCITRTDTAVIDKLCENRIDGLLLGTNGNGLDSSVTYLRSYILIVCDLL